MKPINELELIKTIKTSQIWGATCVLLSLFCTLCFLLYMWTVAAFSAILFAVYALFWLIIKQTTALRLENRK